MVLVSVVAVVVVVLIVVVLSCLFSHNTEKVVYFLLLDRKLRNPCKDDDEDIKAKSECGRYLLLFFIYISC